MQPSGVTSVAGANPSAARFTCARRQGSCEQGFPRARASAAVSGRTSSETVFSKMPAHQSGSRAKCTWGSPVTGSAFLTWTSFCKFSAPQMPADANTTSPKPIMMSRMPEPMLLQSAHCGRSVTLTGKKDMQPKGAAGARGWSFAGAAVLGGEARACASDERDRERLANMPKRSLPAPEAEPPAAPELKESGDTPDLLAQMLRHQAARKPTDAVSEEEVACEAQLRTNLTAAVLRVPPSKVVSKAALAAFKAQHIAMRDAIAAAPKPTPASELPAEPASKAVKKE